MASSRDGSSIWSRLRPRPSVDPVSLRSRPVLPMDIWNLLDEFTGVQPLQGSTARSAGPFVYDVDAMDRFFTDWVWLTNRNRGREDRAPERVDTAAVLRKCRKVVYKPTSTSIWGKAKADTDQSECPVCLEKLVAKDKLLMLPCKHQFHVDCLTPWIKRNHACCPCCRADILRGPEQDEKASASAIASASASAGASGSNIVSFRQGRNSGAQDLRIDSTASNQGSNRGRDPRNNTAASSRSTGRWGSRSGEEDTNAWEGLHEYIMSALAEVDAELSRFMR